MKMFVFTLLVATMVLHAQACDDSPCAIRCMFGLKVDMEGCQVCECQEEECFNLPESCELGSVCKVFDLTSHATKVAKCITDKYPENCQAPRDNGPCKALVFSWYFDTDSSTCKEFGYGGCRGNENRFPTQEMCESSCTQGSPNEECSPVSCMMFCENGFKKDKRGCDLCECVQQNMKEQDIRKPTLYEKKDIAKAEEGTPNEECSQVMCMMFCENGFKKDKRGCDLCECVQQTMAKAEALSSCPEFTCKMLCENGFQKNVEGCDMCKCKVDCPEIGCAMECEFGYQTDADNCDLCVCKGDPNCMLADCGEPCPGGRKIDDGGCEMCECVEGGGCPEAACQMECPFGFDKDRYGCELCQCKGDPCDRIQCKETEVCRRNEKMNDPNNPAAKCVDPYLPSDCKDTMCAMFCEFGFKRDMFGCEVCECLPSEKTACSASHYCRKWCQFGYNYQENGCRDCTCLPNPCLDQKNGCEAPRVCEAFKNCVDSYCPARPRCIDSDRVKRIGIDMSFLHDPIPEEFDFSTLQRPVQNHLATLFGVASPDIRSLEVIEQDEETLGISFHLIWNASANINLVEAYDNFKTKIDTLDEPVPMPYEGIKFVPVAKGIIANYSSSSAIPQDNGGSGSGTGDSKGNTQMIIIIVCAVAGGLVLVAVIAAIVVAKTRKSSDSPKKSVKYEKTATTDEQEPEARVTNA